MAVSDTNPNRPSMESRAPCGENNYPLCSFCQKTPGDVGPLVEGPSKVYICADCVELIQIIIDEEKMRRSGGDLLSYLHFKASKISQMVDHAILCFDPRMAQLLQRQGRECVNPAVYISVSNLCAANALLTIVADIVRDIKTKGLQPGESKMLETIEKMTEQLKGDLTVRADREVLP